MRVKARALGQGKETSRPSKFVEYRQGMENLLTREAVCPAPKQSEAISKKNSEPMITSAFTAENQSGFIMIRTNDSQISECCQGAKLSRPITYLAAVCVH
jgi:hypothetical protein